MSGSPSGWQSTAIPAGRTSSGAATVAGCRSTSERPTEGGTVAVYTNITELKRAEAEILAAKQETERPTRLSHKNQALEALSSKLSKYLSPQVYCVDIHRRAERRDRLQSQEAHGVLLRHRRIHFDHRKSGAGGDHWPAQPLSDRDVEDRARAWCNHRQICGRRHAPLLRRPGNQGARGRTRRPACAWPSQCSAACGSCRANGARRATNGRSRCASAINTGYCTVGNFGSADRMDYTIIGNEVNLASRLQSHAEPGGILMTHETYSLVKDLVPAEEQEPVQVKGFAKPLRNYKVLGLYDDLVHRGKRHPRRTRRIAHSSGSAKTGQSGGHKGDGDRSLTLESAARRTPNRKIDPR